MINNQRGVKRRFGYNILIFGKPWLNNCFRAQEIIVPTSLYLVWQRPGDKSKTTNFRLQQMLIAIFFSPSRHSSLSQIFPQFADEFINRTSQS